MMPTCAGAVAPEIVSRTRRTTCAAPVDVEIIAAIVLSSVGTIVARSVKPPVVAVDVAMTTVAPIEPRLCAAMNTVSTLAFAAVSITHAAGKVSGVHRCQV